MEVEKVKNNANAFFKLLLKIQKYSSGDIYKLDILIQLQITQELKPVDQLTRS